MKTQKFKISKLKHQIKELTFSDFKIIQKQVLEKRRLERENEQKILSELFDKIYPNSEESEETGSES